MSLQVLLQKREFQTLREVWRGQFVVPESPTLLNQGIYLISY